MSPVHLQRSVFAALTLTALGCAELPQKPATQALYVDLRKAEQLSEDTGWVIDRIQLDENLEYAMRSVCRADSATQDDLERYLEHRITELGGPAKEQYAKNGHDIDALDDVLSEERTLKLLRHARGYAEQDCPFYIEPEPDFDGIEHDLSRITVWVESQGFGALLIEQGQVTLSGGGGLRVLLGHPLSPELTLAIGGEVGGSGALNKTDDGSSQLDTVITAAVPVTLRLTQLSRLFDLTLTPVFRFKGDEKVFPPGLRATIGGGLSGMRSGAFMPYLIVYAGVEHHLRESGVPSITSIRVGTRVGVDFDP